SLFLHNIMCCFPIVNNSQTSTKSQSYNTDLKTSSKICHIKSLFCFTSFFTTSFMSNILSDADINKFQQYNTTDYEHHPIKCYKSSNNNIITGHSNSSCFIIFKNTKQYTNKSNPIN